VLALALALACTCVSAAQYRRRTFVRRLFGLWLAIAIAMCSSCRTILALLGDGIRREEFEPRRPHSAPTHFAPRAGADRDLVALTLTSFE